MKGICKVVIVSSLFAFLICNYAMCQVKLGANFNKSNNGFPNDVIEDSGVEWIRTFVDVRPFVNENDNTVRENNLRNNANFESIRQLTSGPDRKKLILGFRWFYLNSPQDIPEPGSAREQVFFDIFNITFEEIGDRIDYLVLGNEPFLETTLASQTASGGATAPVVSFNERLLTEVVLPYYRNKTIPEIFVGSFNALDESEIQNLAGVRQLIEFAEDNEHISGIDLHSHAQFMQRVDDQLSFVRNEMGFTKKILETEFSVVSSFGRNKNDQLGSTTAGQSFVEEWGAANSFTNNTTVGDFYTYVNAQNPANEVEMFLEMFQSREWYIEDFMGKFLDIFNQYNVDVATYGLTQTSFETGLGAAWWANKVYMPFTLGYDENQIPIRNPMIAKQYFMADTSQTVITSINENKQELFFYPNPANKYVVIGPRTGNVVAVNFLDMNGRFHNVPQLEGFSHRYDVSQLRPGVYLIQLHTSSGELIKDRVIIK